MNYSTAPFSSNPLFSRGASQAISTLSGAVKCKGKAHFPSWLGDSCDVRIKNDQSVASWFRTIAGETDDPKSRILRDAINDHFALVGVLAWDKGSLKFCRLHAVVVENGTLLDLYDDDPKETITARYYRLDYDVRKPGPLFCEPLPHIHCIPEGAPRFPLPGSSQESLPIRFIEFIYINHFHDEWLKWARAEVEKHCDEDFPFESIVEGYASGSIAVRLAELQTHIEILKSTLSRAKAQFHQNSPPIPEEIRGLNYFDSH